ncbi:hypothetical protein OIN60_03415 [Paenibacillus sp. P96]|uniref:Uncharacterized protein n=1 Tax=Paenibacillus zeirhizosphaerae TaxID=2987519 RepID=A0ABT9FM78_9BACL|nr:hypothetical protein [Paenibacillus sp. P96]MDP4095839.1 hypothetical protein [Paenibacillus sp. P96]
MEAEQILKMLETVLDDKLKPLKQEMTDMKQDITDMKLEITSIRQDMTDMKQDISGLHTKLDSLAPKQPDDTLALLQIINTKLDSIQKDVEFTFLKTSKNELEINRLKTQ